MGLARLFGKQEVLLALDIGSTGIKLIELDPKGDRPRLINIAVAPVNEEVFVGHVLSKGDRIVEKIAGLMQANEVSAQRAAIAMPGPSVFTKRIKIPKLSPMEISSHVQLEAGSFIPHDVDDVKIDFHVVGATGRNQLEVLVVAVKNEVIDGYLNTLQMAGIQVALVDADYFALQNCFELGYPDLLNETVALVNIGNRYTSINICSKGQSLLTGTIAVGGRLFTDSIVEVLGVSLSEAEELKKLRGKGSEFEADVVDVLDRRVEYMAVEFNRQLSLFWNSFSSGDGIDRIMLSGGGSLLDGLVGELQEKTGVNCESFDPLRGVEVGNSFDQQYIADLKPLMAVAVGLGVRWPGDKVIPKYND